METEKLEILFSFNCNVNCEFCSFGHKDRVDEQPLSDIYDKMESASEEGVTSISFTGGEPTIRDELPSAVAKAKDLGYETIEIQSNGRMLSYPSYCRNLISKGVNHWIVSIHGPNPRIHDALTRTKGSFKQAKKGIRNLKMLGEEVQINTVVVKKNYRYLTKTAKALLDLEVDTINFLFVNPDGYSLYNEDIIPKMSQAAPHIQEALEVVNDAGTDTGIFYMPFCVLGDKRQFVKHFGKVELAGPDINANLAENRSRQNAKFEGCEDCRLNDKCHGVRAEYVKLYGSDEFKPLN